MEKRGAAPFGVGMALLAVRESAALSRARLRNFRGLLPRTVGPEPTPWDRLIEAAGVAANLSPIGLIPRIESHSRPSKQRSVAGRVDFSVTIGEAIEEQPGRTGFFCVHSWEGAEWKRQLKSATVEA